MKELTIKELRTTVGGGLFSKILGIVSGVAFVIGVVDGFIRPMRCR